MNKFAYVVVFIFMSQIVLASPIPEETPGIPELESIACQPAERPIIDGDLSDWITSDAVWKYFGSQEHVLRGDWGGPEDSSILWSTMWDEDNLYIAGVVWDDIYTQPTEVIANWRADCIFLYFDADMDTERDNLWSLFLLEDPDDPNAPLIPSARFWPDQGWGPTVDGVNFTVVMDPNLGLGDAGTIYEAAIRLNSLVNMTAEVGGAFALNVGKEEGTVAPDNGKFICWTDQEPGDAGNQFPVNFTDARVILNTAEYERPFNGSIEVSPEAVLSWKPGKYADTHDLYIGTDFNDVSEATRDNQPGMLVAQDLESPTYDPDIDYGSTYYWRIDEINNLDPNKPAKGHIWSFTVRNYNIVDDFESYNDLNLNEGSSRRIYSIWLDGFDNPSVNGSTMGYPTPIFSDGEHFVETEIVHGGLQSAPIFFDNTVATYSEVTVSTDDLTIDSDWATDAHERLSLWFYGDPNNPTTEQMYIKVNNDKVTYDGDLTQAQWQEWSIDLATSGLDLNNVMSFSIGFERTQATGGLGMVFVDDIRLYQPQVPIP